MTEGDGSREEIEGQVNQTQNGGGVIFYHYNKLCECDNKTHQIKDI